MSQHNQHQPSSSETNHSDTWPKLKFLGGLDKLKALDCENQGSSGSVLVEFEDGRLYPISFEAIDGVKGRLEWQLKKGGLAFEAEPGIILLQKVTLRNMRLVVNELANQGEFGFFTYLKEWDPKKEKRLHEKFHSGVNVGTYEYPTVSEEELDEE